MKITKIKIISFLKYKYSLFYYIFIKLDFFEIFKIYLLCGVEFNKLIYILY